MRQYVLIVFGLLCFLNVSHDSAADSITVGAPISANCYPFMCNDNPISFGESIHYQQVYDAGSFRGITQIGALTFFDVVARQFGGTTTVLPGDYRVSLSTTSRSVNGLSLDDLSTNLGTDNSLFFSGPLGGTSTIPSFTIVGSPFTYSSALGNLLLDIVVTNQSVLANGNGNGYNDADISGTVTSRALRTLRGDGATDTIGLVTRFDGPLAPTPEPASLLLLGTGLVLGIARRHSRTPLKRQRNPGPMLEIHRPASRSTSAISAFTSVATRRASRR